MTPEALYELCQQVAKKLIERYDWQLLEKEQLAQQLFTHGSMTSLQTTEGLNRVTYHLCSVALYHACTAEDQQQQIRGYRDLSNYLHDRAGREGRKVGYDQEIAGDLAQDALEEVWTRIEECQAPDTFLKFCDLCLLHAKTNHQRRARRNIEDTTQGSLSPESQGRELATELPSPEQTTLCMDLLERLVASVERIYRQKKKAAKQFEVLYWSHLMGLSDPEIATRMAVTVDKVYLWKNRGHRQLCGDEEFVTLFSEWVTSCKTFGEIVLYL